MPHNWYQAILLKSSSSVLVTVLVLSVIACERVDGLKRIGRMRQPDYFKPTSEEKREAPSNEFDDDLAYSYREYYVNISIEEEDTSAAAIRHFDDRQQLRDLPLNTTPTGLRYRIVKWGLICVLVLIPLILLPILFLYVRNSEKTRPCDDMMWSFNKTAIRDLPSSDVHSIHIENGFGPVEVGDEAFEWHELKSKKTSEQSAPPVTTEQPLSSTIHWSFQSAILAMSSSRTWSKLLRGAVWSRKRDGLLPLNRSKHQTMPLSRTMIT